MDLEWRFCVLYMNELYFFDKIMESILYFKNSMWNRFHKFFPKRLNVQILGINIRHKNWRVIVNIKYIKGIVKIIASAVIFTSSISSASAEDFTIGLSNGWVGSEWRTQMIEEAEIAAKAWA
ncbi:MAG: hypothetical protein V7782_05100, partial [Psychromonas sp.]